MNSFQTEPSFFLYAQNSIFLNHSVGSPILAVQFHRVLKCAKSFLFHAAPKLISINQSMNFFPTEL